MTIEPSTTSLNRKDTGLTLSRHNEEYHFITKHIYHSAQLVHHEVVCVIVVVFKVHQPPSSAPLRYRFFKLTFSVENVGCYFSIYSGIDMRKALIQN